jgi:CRISPR/Cas system CSM-associated protein Csm2 small subunit
LLLKTYFDENGNLLKEIYIELPNNVAELFSRDRLKIKQLRDFYSIISGVRNKALLKGIEQARPLLWQCVSKLEYQLKREIIPQSFVDFMKHHIELAQKDEKSLDAFYQHLDSIVCYFPR